MSFLYSIFLPALAAAAIPILLHFLSRQRLPVIEFSSLEFLHRLQKRQARRVRIRQIILLILRTLALLALVMAFARPALKSHADSSGSASSVEMVIILDDGIAASAEQRGSSLLGRGIDYVNALVRLADANDHVTLFLGTEPSRPLTASGGETTIIIDELSIRQPRLYPPQFAHSLANADTIFRKSDRFNRELYIVGPFYDDAADSLVLPTIPNGRIRLIPTGPDRLANASVEQVQLVSAIRQKGRPVELKATIVNHGEKALEELPVSLYIGDERVAQGSVDIPGETSVVREFVFTVDKSGLLPGSIRLDLPDALTADNRSHFVLDVPEKLSLLVVAGDSLELTILNSVFASGPEHYYDLTLRLAGNWETESPGKYDAILLADLPAISPGGVQRLEEFVARGGGIILMPGAKSDISDWSRGLLSRLGFSPVAGVMTGGVHWGKFDRSHPLFNGVFEESGAPRVPTLSFALNLSAGRGDIAIVPLTTGAPFLIERGIGQGRALLFASPPSPVSGEFIFSGIFAPLLFRSAAYVAAGRSGVDEAWIAGTVRRPVIPTSRIVGLEMVNPRGESFALQPRPLLGGVEYDAGLIELTGHYRFEINGSTVAQFPANVRPGSGRLIRSDLKKLTASLPNAEIMDVPPEEIADEIRSARFGRELWQPIAAMFLSFLVAESIVGRAGRKETS